MRIGPKVRLPGDVLDSLDPDILSVVYDPDTDDLEVMIDAVTVVLTEQDLVTLLEFLRRNKQ